MRRSTISREREIALLSQVASGLKSNRSRSNSNDRARLSTGHRNSNRVKTPSPANSIGSNGSLRRKRFNPTEYVKDKNKKLEEIELKKQRNINRNMNKQDKLLFNNKSKIIAFFIG